MNNPLVEQLAIKYVLSVKSPELLVKLEEDLFSNEELRKVMRLIKRHYLDRAVFVSFDVLTAEVVKLSSTKDKADFMYRLLLMIQEKDISDVSEDYILTELKNCRKLRTFLDKSAALVSAVEANDVAKAEAILTETFQQIYVGDNFDLDQNDASNMLGDSIEFNFKSTSVPQIDERGGLIQGGLTIVAGEAKSGKSVLSEQICTHIFKTYEESISYHSYEQSVPELIARQLSAEAEVDLGKLIAKTLDQEETLRVRKAQIELYFHNPKDLDVEDFCRCSITSSNNEFAELVDNSFERRDNRFFFFREGSNWDDLFTKLRLLITTKNVKTICIDYPFLVSNGVIPKGLSQWEYALSRIQALKSLSHESGLTNIIIPAQYDSNQDRIRFVSNSINACDLCLSMNGNSNDDKTLGCVTFSFKAYRNYLTVPEKPFLQDFRMMKQFQYSRFLPFEM